MKLAQNIKNDLQFVVFHHQVYTENRITIPEAEARAFTSECCVNEADLSSGQ